MPGNFLHFLHGLKNSRSITRRSSHSSRSQITHVINSSALQFISVADNITASRSWAAVHNRSGHRNLARYLPKTENAELISGTLLLVADENSIAFPADWLAAETVERAPREPAKRRRPHSLRMWPLLMPADVPDFMPESKVLWCGPWELNEKLFHDEFEGRLSILSSSRTTKGKG